MKKLILILISIVMFSAIAFAATPPAAVLKAFNLKFPNATKVKWDKENAHEYEASFVMDNAKYAANYTDKGEWLETESPLTFKQLPAEVQKAFTTAHKNMTAKLVSKIEQAKGTIKYEVEVKQGLKTVEYFYNADGTETK
jgi:hypothetical protein